MAMIEVQGLTKSYGGTDVVRGVDFEVSEGEIFGILGPNGAGKTTTVECIGGLRTRDAGHVRVAGFDPADEDRGLREALGIQLQESRLPDKQTVGEAMRLYSSFYSAPRDWRELLERLDIRSQERTYFGNLSGGQKQRLSVALALVGNPKVAILDELTTGLDPSARREVWGLLEDLKDTGVTFLLVSHFMEEAERLCDRVAVINAGRIVALDTPADLAAAVHTDQRMSFIPTAGVDPDVLTALPDVHRIDHIGDRVVVTGTDNVSSAVIIALHERGIACQKLRVDQPGLDDAFLALTRNIATPEQHGSENQGVHR
ncbi:ABC transporter ATP-binding protein [Jongsikchunia kroppenstedtii]|uniref:ABC transporter ATP-binding protein n=1 Tax=Jongsikchunia kroppenstedtii TaxID=1121721 RepID=UPI0005BA232B|nr:ABC transporter ATP-binding protein [Jongsikchunia kroppenstedtii]